ncbi:MAG: ATP-dependent DNA helicase [Patescibacteria group bacterium]
MVKKLGTNDLLKDLNPEQKVAVTHGDGPLLIVAGAGTGKTTVITRRIAWLIEQKKAKPNEILALTFTDKAAGEMEERVDKLLPLGYVNLWVSTFHSFAERVLKDYGLDIGLPGDFKLLNTTEQWLLVKQNLDKFDLDYYRPLGNSTKFVHALIKHFSRAKDEEVYPGDYLKLAESQRLNTGQSEFLKISKSKSTRKSKDVEKTESEIINEDENESVRLQEVARAYHVYQKLLLDNNALDFGDLINYCLKLFRTRLGVLKHFQKQFKYILIDEFQDTNYAQYELIKILAAPANNVTVVGDDDQSIFKFRGASISNILEFKKDYPQAKEILLITNYRSTQDILDLSYKFIQQNNPYRLEIKLSQGAKKLSKKLKAVSCESGNIELLTYSNLHQESFGVINKIVELKKIDSEATWDDFAILVRANASAEPFLQGLRKASIPFEYVASRGLYQEAIILDLMAYFKLLDNYHESQALYRILTTPWFKLPNSDLSSLLYFANRKALSLYEAINQSKTIPLSTEGQKIVENLLNFITKHSSFAREKTASETYLRVIRDIGVSDWLVQNQDNYEVIKQANYLTAFFKKTQEFELDNTDKSLNNFLNLFALELEAGEEGELPPAWEEGPEMVKVITVHSAKGLEFKYVFIVQLVDRRFPSTERREAIVLPTELIKEILPEGDVHLQEERRLFYVAMTRAKRSLYFTYALDYFGKQKRKPSQFLYELGLADKNVYDKSTVKDESMLDKKETSVKTRKVSYSIPEHFSFSSISSYLKCPLEFKYRYLLKIPTPGNAYLSFGSSMHKALEHFMKLWQSRLSSEQLGLFTAGSKTKGKIQLPTIKELENIYQEVWLDDWYESKQERENFKKRGLEQIKTFYDAIKNNPPQPKYIEQFFKIRFGDYKFVGKIDRMDVTVGGVNIIDYKTGENPPKNLAKVDKDQLLIYQLAAQEFLQEKVVNCQYWYLNKNVWSDPFLGAAEELEDLQARYLEVIEQIIESIKQDNFSEIHKDGGHDCQYKFLI